MTTDPYRPIDCGLHDRLLDWATRGVRIDIRYRAASGQEASIRDVLLDVWTEAGAEYLRTSGGVVIRLDALLEVEGFRFPPG